MTFIRQHALAAPRRLPFRGRSAADRLAPHSTSLMMLMLAILATVVASDWIAGAGVIVLWLAWYLLIEEEHPPVLPLAVSFQWVQVTIGVYYVAVTGREVEAHYASDYRPMVLLGLGCIVALTVGLRAGLSVGDRILRGREGTSDAMVPWRTLLIAYLAATAGAGVLGEIAWSVPGLTQGIISVGFVRLGILFLMFRRLVRYQLKWQWFFGLLAGELMLGFTGYFASFREALILAALAVLEVFRPRSMGHWLRVVAVGAVMGLAGVTWMGIRSALRSDIDSGAIGDSRVERLERVGELSSTWIGSDTASVAQDLDQLVERLWAVYYPALAIARVPSIMPHGDGAILSAAVKHVVTPRLLFPDKGALPSDSEMVRKYSGIYVAGSDEGTSIAFGYAAESYIDFGLPWMFLPSVFFGVVMGVAYRYVFRVIHHRELAVGLASVVFWLSLYLFERSWIKTFGLALTLLIFVGGVVFALDRFLARQPASKRFRPTRRPRGVH